MHFNDIPQFPYGNYKVDLSWSYLEQHLQHHINDYYLDIDPDFQREHVWTKEQQVAYVEFKLRGGRSGGDLLFNCPGWTNGHISKTDYVLVDGKQRLEAARAFMSNRIKAFGHYYSEFEGSLGLIRPDFQWNIAELKTRAEILQWYLAFNSGGVVHTEEELSKVRGLLEQEQAKSL